MSCQQAGWRDITVDDSATMLQTVIGLREKRKVSEVLIRVANSEYHPVSTHTFMHCRIACSTHLLRLANLVQTAFAQTTFLTESSNTLNDGYICYLKE